MTEIKLKKDKLLSANCIGLTHFCTVLAVLFVISACTGMSCEERAGELKSLYNDTVDQVVSLGLGEIVAKCDEALEQCPELAIAYELKGLVYWEAERLNEGLECYLKALAVHPEDENLLIDTRLLAFSAKGAYLQISNTGRIEISPFKNITLAQYAACPEENRLQWCQQVIDIRNDSVKPSTIKYVNRQGNVVGTGKLSYRFDSSSPADLDALLLAAGKKKPGAVLHEESLTQSLLGDGMGMQQVTE